MIFSLFYVVLAILGLSFLIFIHELGHYWMARRVGMRVETFAIGFGKPIYVWERDGVKWQIGWLLFGGYVKIAGTDTEKDADPYEVPDGFFGKSPWDRIKVALAGPFVNLIFAFILFGALWSFGGREKSFVETTSKIGWLDPKSELFASGVRPGDEISAYEGRPFQGIKDHVYASMLGGSEVNVKGYKIDYSTGEKTPFEYKIKPYPHPTALDKGRMSLGILQPANFIIYNRLPNRAENPLPEGSPLKDSGIEYGDRVFWIDGLIVYSSLQLDDILNDNRALLTIKRGDEIKLMRVPRIQVQELKLDSAFKEELVDWQFEAGLNGIKIQKLYAIPYNLTNDCIVENELKFIDNEKQEEAFLKHPLNDNERPLLPGDKILAVDGTPVEKSFQLLQQLQTHQVNIIVQRDSSAIQKISWKNADEDFDKHIDTKDLKKITQSIGTGKPVTSAGDLVLLKPIVPKARKSFVLSPETQAWLATEMLERKKEIETIEDPEKRAQALNMLDHQEKKLLLGLPQVQDRKVNYNPLPTEMFTSVFQEIWRTLGALFTGSLSPKWLSGPIGIVQVVHDNWMVSAKEALFWIAAISLNLGVLNLLPIPVLDGGTILLSLIEMVTKRRINPKTLEKVILPFAVLLIAFFIFLTYHDLSRIFGGFLR